MNGHSNIDIFQAGGGGQTSLSESIGRALMGEAGALIGRYLSLGEIGFAGRKFDGAQNIAVTRETLSINPVRIHSNLWQKQSVWSKVSNLIK